MSNFLNYYDGQVTLGSSRLYLQNLIKSNLVANSWQVVTEDTTNMVLDVIPPITETIGDGRVISVTRIRTEDLAVRVYPYLKCVGNYLGQIFYIEQSVAGAVAGSVTIDGQTVTQGTTNAGFSAAENLRQLWLSLRASANATYLDWDFYWLPPYIGHNADGGTTALICACRKTCSNTRQTISVNANVTLWDLSTGGWVNGNVQEIGTSYITDHTTSPHAKFTFDVTINLTNGFVYFMSVFSRTFSLATKCITGWTGPVVASWIDNTEARAATPKSRPQVAVPMELFILCLDGRYGFSDTTIDIRNNALTTHHFGFNDGNPALNRTGGDVQSGWANGGNYGNSRGDSFYRSSMSRTWYNAVQYDNFNGPASNRSYAIFGSIFGIGLSTMGILDNFPIQTLACNGAYYATSPASLNGLTDLAIPPINLPDVYGVVGITPTEGLMLSSDERVSTTTTASYDATTAYTTLAVTSTTGFPTSGIAILGNEQWTYTNKTANTLTGCTRAANASKAEPSTSGDTISPGVWFLRFNRGGLRAGYTKPV